MGWGEGTRRGQGRRARNVDQRPPFSHQAACDSGFSIRPHVVQAFPSGYTFRLSHQATRCSGFPIRLHVVPAFPSGYTFRLSHQAACSGFSIRPHVVPAFPLGYMFWLFYQVTRLSGFLPIRIHFSGFPTWLHFPAFPPGYTFRISPPGYNVLAFLPCYVLTFLPGYIFRLSHQATSSGFPHQANQATTFRLSYQATRRSGFPTRLHVIPAFLPRYTSFRLSYQATRRSGFPTRLHVIPAFLPGYRSFWLSYQVTRRSGLPNRLHFLAFLPDYTFRLSHQATRRSGFSQQATRSGFLTRLHVLPAFLPGYTSFRLLLTRGWKSKDNVMTTFREQVLHIAKNDTGNWFTQHLKMMTPVGL